MKKWIASAAVAAALMLTPLQQAFANIGDQTLKQEKSHSDVKQLQQLLQNEGYFTYPNSLSTYYGTTTVAAVKNFVSSPLFVI